MVVYVIMENLILYSMTYCDDCALVKEWLNDNKIAYKEKIVDDASIPEQRINRDKLFSHGIYEVPTIEFPDGQLIVISSLTLLHQLINGDDELYEE